MFPPSCVPEDSSALTYALDSVHHSPGKQPDCHYSNLLRYIRSLEWAKLFSLISAATSTTPLQDLPLPLPLLLLLEVPCPDFERLFLLSPCVCPPGGPLTFTHKSSHLSRHAYKCTIDFHSQVNTTSQEHACKCTIDFHSQVSSHLKTCSQTHR